MYISIRESSLKSAGYGSIGEGLADLGLESVELEFRHDYTVFSPGAWEPLGFEPEKAGPVIGEAFRGAGVGICALLLHNNFNCEDREAEIKWVCDAVRAAGAAGIPAVRIDAVTKGEKEEPFETRVDRFVECMRRVVAETADSTVRMGIENHGVQGNDPAFLEKVIARVGSDRLGVTMDTGNFYWAGHPLSRVYEILASLAPLAKHTHLKNIRYPEETREIQREGGWKYRDFVSPIYEGDIDHRRVVSLLREAGYRGPLTIEDESLGKFDQAGRREVLKKDVAHLREILA